MVDLIAVTALVVSVLTAVFVAIKQGIGLSIEYRESAETLRRREAIEARLHDQIGVELTAFLQYCASQKQLDIKDIEIRKKVIELGTRTRYLNLGTTLLEEMTRFSKKFLRTIAASLPFIFITIVFATYFWEVDPFLSAFLIILYGSPTVYIVYVAASQLDKYYFARERFVALSENASLDNCQFIIQEMRKRGML